MASVLRHLMQHSYMAQIRLVTSRFESYNINALIGKNAMFGSCCIKLYHTFCQCINQK